MLQNRTPNIIQLYIIKLSKWLMLTMPVVFLFYRENGLGTQELFILKAVYSVSIMALEIPSGYFGDMWGRKTSLVTGSVLGFIGFAIYCVSSGFYSFLAAEVILGIGQSFISGSDSAMLYDTLLEAEKEKDYLKTEGRLISFGNYAEAVAAPIGVMLAAASLRTPYYFQAAVAFTAIPAALALKEPTRRKMKEVKNAGNMLCIFRYAFLTNRALSWSITFSAVIGTATLTMAWMIQPLFVSLSVPLALYGIVIPLLNLTAGTVSMYAHLLEKSLGRRGTVIIIAAGISSTYLILGLLQSMWAICLLFLFYIIRGIATPVLRNHINRSTPSEIRATVLSIRSMIIRLIFATLGPVAGWYADRSGLSSSLGAAGLLFMATGACSAFYLLKEQAVARKPRFTPPALKNGERSAG